MQTQFEVFIDSLGNVSMSRGMVLDLTGAQPEYFPVGESSINDPLNETYRLSSNATTEFSGGSGENIFVSGSLANPSIDVFGHYRKTSLPSWSKKNGFNIQFNSISRLHEISDGIDVLATFPGLETQRDLVQCSSLAQNSGQGDFIFEVFLGTDLGVVDFDYEAFSIPDRFIVSYNGVDVIDTGFVGDSGIYDGNNITVSGDGTGSTSFTKSSAEPRIAYVRVIAPFSGTAWNFNMGCPGGASNANPPRPPRVTNDVSKLLFTATSTTYGDTINESAFTLDVIYENKQPDSFFNCTSTLDIFSGTYYPKGYSRWSKSVLFTTASIPQLISVSGAGTFPSLYLDQINETDFSDGTYFLNYIGSSLYNYSISDATNVISYLAANVNTNQFISPIGVYTATAYGAATYGVTVGEVLNYVEFPSTRVFFDLYSKPDGSAELHDGTNIVASISQADQLSPNGTYLVTQYGKDTYNFGDDFEILFSDVVRNTAGGWFYIQVNFNGTIVDSVSGPFFRNNMPDNTTTLKNIPIAYSYGNGVVDQIHEGTLIFK